MWVCPRCAANNQLDACWQCRAPRPVTGDAGAAGAPTSAAPTPPTGPPPPATGAWYPGYGAGSPSPVRPPVWPWVIAGVAVAVAVFLLIGSIALRRSVDHIAGPSGTLSTPSSIQGLSRVADPNTDAVASQLQSIPGLRVVSGVYGTGAVHYVVVALTGGLVGARLAPADTVVALAAGQDAVDPSSRTTVTRGGVTFTCSRLTGDIAGATCSWSANSVNGAVVQLGSPDIAAAADFAAAARRSLQGS